MISPKHRPPHPGSSIKYDIIDAYHLTQEQLAQSLGVSRRTVNLIINGKRPITPEMAYRISLVDGSQTET